MVNDTVLALLCIRYDDLSYRYAKLPRHPGPKHPNRNAEARKRRAQRKELQRQLQATERAIRARVMELYHQERTAL